MRKLRVLFIEDREDDAMLVVRELKRAGFDVDYRRVETEPDMRLALQQGEWDVIISDFSMPRFTGPAALEVLKETQLDIPFIMASGTVGEETAVTALKAGAHDFLSKRNLTRLVPALERELREAQSRRERRHAEERLRASEAALAGVFRASPLPIVTVDMDDRVTAWNPAAERVLGWSMQEMLGRNPPFPTGIDRNEIDVERQNGATLRIIVSVSPLEGPDGQRSGTVAVITDVTERRALEEQFRQAQKMEAVGQLAGGIAHDFNNILTAIQGYATLTLTAMSPDSQHYQDIQEILDAAVRAASFTRQLLAFSRKQVTQPELLETNQVIANMRNMLGRVIGDRYSLELDLGPAVGPIFADRGHIEQVVMNLIVNARDAMTEGGTILLRTDRVLHRPDGATFGADNAAPGPYTVLRVRDSGHGIAEETLERIFEPFFTTKEVGKGTGLGLSTVYGIVSQNRGFLCVESEPGKGSEFSVYLPEPDGQPSVGQVEPPAAGQDATDPFARSVLIVEDDAFVRRLLKRTLERAGFHVMDARDGAEGLHILRANAGIDALITDMMLPGMSGAELITEATALHPHIKTVLISGYSSEDLALPPHYAFIEKPFAPDHLVRVLEACFPRTTGADR